jgi:two-component system chemotaxis response regulator CheY
VERKKATAKNKASLKMLIVNDDPAQGQMLRKMLIPFGETGIAFSPKEAVETFQSALKEGNPFDLICIDMLPETNGRKTLRHIRKIEREKGVHALDGVKIMMITAAGALEGSQNNMEAFKSGCEGYLKKPVEKKKLINLLKTLSFDSRALKKSR